jgi:hypothetical protein
MGETNKASECSATVISRCWQEATVLFFSLWSVQ